MFEKRKIRITWVLVIVFFGVVIFGRGLKFDVHTDVPENKTAAHLPYKTMYNTIISNDFNNLLISYELHEGGEYNDGTTTCPQFSAVIRGIDSQKDNYKVLCRDVVSDVIKTCGNKEIVVNIYDSFEAYTLARAEQQYKYMSKEEEDTINKHRVAAYSLTYRDDCDVPIYSLTFYPDAQNGLTEHDNFTLL